MSTSTKEIVLITGANTGLGFEIAKKLLRDHGDRFYVLVGARTASKGEAAVKQLQEQGWKDCEFVQIDNTDNESITQAAGFIKQKFGKLDVLHANAGIAPDKDLLPNNTPISRIINTAVATNAAGSAQVAETFIPLLQKSSNPRVIFMSTGLGSIELCKTIFAVEQWPGYAASKAALNMVMVYFHKKYPGMRVNACSPGFRATALNNFGEGAPPGVKAGETAKGADNAVRLTLLGRDGESGTHTAMDDATGEVQTIPW